MNVIILVSVLSIGLSAVYGGSRTLTALAQQGYAPRVFTFVDRSGRPLYSVMFILAFSFLAYINLSPEGAGVFDWLLALSGLAALFTWGSICLAHIRFRKAWAHQGHTLDEIPFRAVCGVYGSWAGLVLVVLVFIAQVCAIHPLNPISIVSRLILTWLCVCVCLSSTSLSVPLVINNLMTHRDFSSRISLSRSSLSSGSVAGCGRAKGG
jgi:amino acid permease